MVHGKSQDQGTSGSEDLAIYGHGGHLGHVTKAIYINLFSSSQGVYT